MAALFEFHYVFRKRFSTPLITLLHNKRDLPVGNLSTNRCYASDLTSKKTACMPAAQPHFLLHKFRNDIEDTLSCQTPNVPDQSLGYILEIRVLLNIFLQSG